MVIPVTFCEESIGIWHNLTKSDAIIRYISYICNAIRLQLIPVGFGWTWSDHTKQSFASVAALAASYVSQGIARVREATQVGRGHGIVRCTWWVLSRCVIHTTGFTNEQTACQAREELLCRRFISPQLLFNESKCPRAFSNPLQEFEGHIIVINKQSSILSDHIGYRDLDSRQR